VIFVPFDNGRPNGQPLDVLTGFLSEDASATHGRPVGVAVTRGRTLLVADDVGNTVWHVTAAGAAAVAPSSSTPGAGEHKPQ
jgi:glucose/arabinose dehydrogenase